MTTDELRSKLEPYFNSNKGYIIVKTNYEGCLSKYSIVLRQGGFVYNIGAHRVVPYWPTSLYSSCDIEKCFYTENHSLIEKVLAGVFTKDDELSRYIEEIKFDEDKKDTSDIINKYGLATQLRGRATDSYPVGRHFEIVRGH